MTSYKEIPLQDSDAAIQWLYAKIAMARPKVRRKDPEKWRQSFYKPIYARAGELGLHKEELYAFAADRLSLKIPIGSLKDLTQQNLEKLHRIMIAEVKKSKN